MSNYCYKILFNNPCSEKSSFEYSYGNTKNIRISIAKGRAVVSFNMSVKKSFDEFRFMKVKLFQDAYRKVLLCHACKYGYNLPVKKILITINDDVYELNKDNTEHFPPVTSMISEKKFEINKSFSSKEFLNKVVAGSKSETENDLRFVALYSFLQSKNRQFEIDKFTNLWTSMNAVYNYNYSLIEKDIKNSNVSEKEEMQKLFEKYGFKGKLSSKTNRSNNKSFYRNAKILLSSVRENEYKKLYDFAFSKSKEKHFEQLSKCADELKMDLFPFLLFELPYYLRCNYFHGNQCTMLISSYNNYELRCFEVINYFLDRFLDNVIPKMMLTDKEADKWKEQLRK